MTDTTMSNQQIAIEKGKSGGFAKAGLAGLYMDFCQHVTPPLAGALFAKYPIIGEAFSFEIVVAALALAGTIMIKLTPNHFIAGICDAIVWLKQSWRKITAAAHSE